ncbi:MAG: succinate dehydrogenase cytochrome b subunit [Bacteroidia bacterium]|nr:succinate dehydrogenase cytochrome b subunit [Bacteroidia bacterium]
MSNFINSSIGKKVIMSLSGLFLLLFLAVHLSLNLLTLVGEETYNTAAHFMATNPAMKVLEIVLALGFLLHIIYSLILTLQNMTARPVKYNVPIKGVSSSWESRNMFILGLVILLALILHLINYYYKIKFTDLIKSGEMTEYKLVTNLFTPEYWYYVVIYIVWFIALGLHVNHSLRSSFHTLGLNNKVWEVRLKFLGSLYALIVSIGFTIIPLYFLLSAFYK